MIFISQGKNRAKVIAQRSRKFWQENPHCYFAFPCNFHHDSAEAKYFFFEDLLHPFVRIIFACGRSYITFAMRKSMLDMPIRGSF